MTVTVESFRAAFPAFAVKATYPDPELVFWLGLGLKLMNVDRWGDLLDYGQMLFAAHNLSLEFNAKNASRNGQNPGQVLGALSSGTVDKVSYSRDTSSVMDPKNGHWNLSIYGIRYIRLVGMIGAGPVQVGVDAGDYIAPWAGVIYGPMG